MLGSLIVAVSNNNVIGFKQDIPWRLSVDLQRFKKITWGSTLLMGRKTFDSLGQKPLPGRNNWVLTRQKLDAPSVCVFNTWQNMLEAALHEKSGWFVIGGSSLYELALPYVNKLYITWVNADIKGDVFFPNIDLANWFCIQEEFFDQDASNQFSFTCCVYEKNE